MPITLRPLNGDNLVACWNLSLSDDQRNESQVENTPNLLQKYTGKENITQCTFYADDTMVGYAVYEHATGTTWYEILYFFIDQHHQGQGYGKAAFKQLLAELMANPDCATIKIVYMSFNDRAGALYKKFGFVDMNEESGYVTAVLICPLKASAQLIEDFVRVATLSGFALTVSDIEYETLPAPHVRPRRLPPGKMVVYVYATTDQCLKVGKAGENSRARFTSQHYIPKSSKSNLAKSLLADLASVGTNSRFFTVDNCTGLSADTIGNWVMENTTRQHFYLDSTYPPQLLSLLEVFLQCRLQPLFEG